MKDDSFVSLAGIPWYASRTVWGGILAGLSPLISHLGYQVDAGELSDILAQLAALAGGLLAVWGRLRATGPIRRL